MNIDDIKVGQKVKVFPPLLLESNILKYGVIVDVDIDNRKFTVDVIDDHIYIYSMNEIRVKHCMEAVS